MKNTRLALLWKWNLLFLIRYTRVIPYFSNILYQTGLRLEKFNFIIPITTLNPSIICHKN